MVGSDTIWTVTGDCHLSALHVMDGAKLLGAEGKKVVLTVKGQEMALTDGKYLGDVRLTLK